MAKAKRITLHPFKEDGTLDLDTNLYPKTLDTAIVNQQGEQVDVITKDELDIALDSKLNKENAPLPTYDVSNVTSVYDFLIENNLLSKPFICTVWGSNPYVAWFSIGHGTSASFDIRSLKSEDRFRSGRYLVDISDKRFTQLISSTYADDFEVTSNKVTSLSSESTDKEYPSAKAVYDAIQGSSGGGMEVVELSGTSGTLTTEAYNKLGKDCLIKDTTNARYYYLAEDNGVIKTYKPLDVTKDTYQGLLQTRYVIYSSSKNWTTYTDNLGKTVEPNPTLTSDDSDLTSIKIGSFNYKITDTDKVSLENFGWAIAEHTYNSTYSYSTGDMVYYNGYLYIADQDISAPAGDFDFTKWTKTTVEQLISNLDAKVNTVSSNLDAKINTIKRNIIRQVNTTTYPTLADFLASTGEEGIIYWYPIDTTDLSKGYHTYVWEGSSYDFAGDTIIDLTNYVTLDGNQNITGQKSFSSDMYTRSIYPSGLNVINTIGHQNSSAGLYNSVYAWRGSFPSGINTHNIYNTGTFDIGTRGITIPDTTHWTVNKTIATLDDVSDVASDIAPLYSSSSTYSLGSRVIYNNKLYRCTTAVTQAEAFDSNKWTEITVNTDFVDVQSDQAVTGRKRFDTVMFNTIESSLVPLDLGTSIYSLGTSSYKWKNLYLNGKINPNSNGYGLALPDTTSFTADRTIATIDDVKEVSDNIAPIYDNTQTYAVGAKVIYNGKLYKCTTAVSTAEDFDSTKWSEITVANGFVDLDSDQIIKGRKIFTANSSIYFGDANSPARIYQDGQSIKFGNRLQVGQIFPTVDKQLDLGNGIGWYWRDLWLSRNIVTLDENNNQKQISTNKLATTDQIGLVSISAPSSTTLTDELLSVFIKGCKVIGTFLGRENPTFWGANSYGGTYYGTVITGGREAIVEAYQIPSATKVISLASTTQNIQLNSVARINLKAIPNYPTTNTERQYLSIAPNGGSLSWEDAPKELPVSLGTAGQVLKVNSGATGVEWANETFRDIEVNGVNELQDTDTDALNLVAGSNISLSTNGHGAVTISATDTTYTAGTGIDITSGTISVDDSVVALQTDLPSGEVNMNINDTTTTATADTLSNIVVGNSTDGYTRYSVPTGMSNPMTTSQDIIVGGASGTPSRLAKGNNGELLRVNSSGNLAYGKNLPIITTAPSAANTDGLIICVLSSEPATKYDGYLYIVTGSNN